MSQSAKVFILSCLVCISLSRSLSAEVEFKFEVLNSPPGTPNGSSAVLVNKDGSALVFKGTKPSNKKDEKIPLVYHWNAKNGYSHLGLFERRNVLVPMDISDVGDVVVGHNGGNSFIWTHQNKMQTVPKLKSNFISTVIAISGDGQTLVGYAGWQSNVHAFRWKRNGQIEDIGKGVNHVEWRNATRVSRNGRVVIGSTQDNVFVWREGQGTENLQSPKGCSFIPEAVSADGYHIAGRCSLDSPLVWSQGGGFKALPIPDGASSAIVHNMASLTKRYIGSARYSGNDYKSISKPIVWINNKIYFIDNVIKKLQPSLNYKKLWVHDISADGTVIVGGYQKHRPYSYPWKLTIKETY
ncbi:hypothetical protein [Aliikangiella sp. IMCC44359]|uniref:hypothetical protein n=1 Tax=Aliikangiella sp. IMCC44359 TaxID=3459125 RepID=UPI00403AE1C7